MKVLHQWIYDDVMFSFGCYSFHMQKFLVRILRFPLAVDHILWLDFFVMQLCFTPFAETFRVSLIFVIIVLHMGISSVVTMRELVPRFYFVPHTCVGVAHVRQA